MTGLVQIDPNDWEPGPYWVIAVIATEPAELSRISQVKFHEVDDDLGLLDIAFLEIPDGPRYILRRYRQSPSATTEIWGIEDVPDIFQSVRLLLKVLGLDETLLLWVAEK